MAKKRTSLDSLLNVNEKKEESTVEVKTSEEKNTKKKASPVKKVQTEQKPQKEETESDKNKIVRQTVYLPNEVYEQVRQLAFEERKKMHDYLVEGLDRVFKNRGLKSFDELKK